MKLLVLGGTLFLGRHVVDAARRRGHEVTVFHRGSHPLHRADVTDLRGDRDPSMGAGLKALEDGAWDAVIDTSGYFPRHVRASAALLEDRGAKSYVFVSTLNAYPKAPPGLDEGHPTHAPLEPASPEQEVLSGEGYGPLKVACEQAVRAAFPDSGALVRAGLIVGPFDQTNRFTYWCTRIAAGGTVLAPEVRDQPIQVVDVRDLADLLVTIAERGLKGPVNVAGPRGQLTFQGLLETIRSLTASDAQIVWVDGDALEAEGVAPWGQLPLWLPPRLGLGGMMDCDDRRARAWGAAFRPIEQTILDTLQWASSSPPPSGLKDWLEVPPAGLSPEREAELLARLAPRG